MKVRSEFLARFHLDKQHFLLTGRSVQIVKEFFDALIVRRDDGLDDVQFLAFMRITTDLSDDEVYKIFDMFDVDESGKIEFDEFYLLICMLISIKDNVEKQFLWRHSRTCFELLDTDHSNSIQLDEFYTFGILFNISHRAASKIFHEFDVDNSQELEFDEFKMFALACIDQQQQLDKLDASASSKNALLASCELL